MNYGSGNKQHKADKVAKLTAEINNQVKIVGVRMACSGDTKEFNEQYNQALKDGYSAKGNHLVIQHENTFKYVQGFVKTEVFDPSKGIQSNLIDELEDFQLVNTSDVDEFNKTVAKLIANDYFPENPYSIRTFEGTVWFEVAMIKTKKVTGIVLAPHGLNIN